MLFAFVDAFTTYYLWNNLSSAIIVFVIILFFMITLTFLKSIIFSDSEIGKVSTIYIEEYRKLQEPKLKRKCFRNYFRKVKLFFNNENEKSKKENNDT